MDLFQTAEIGNTGLHLSRLGLGGAPLGSSDQLDGEAVAAIGRALEMGMRYVDTSPYYGEGRSELRFGRPRSYSFAPTHLLCRSYRVRAPRLRSRIMCA